MMTKKNDFTTILLQRDVIHQRHPPIGIPLSIRSFGHYDFAHQRSRGGVGGAGWVNLTGSGLACIPSSLAAAESDVNRMNGTDLSLRGCPC